jgi:parallel beta-helix repeat protein
MVGQRHMSAGDRIVRAGIFSALALAILIGFGTSSAFAANSCVDANGKHGCVATIQLAIDAVSSPNSTITVNPGTYTVATCAGPGCSVAVISSAASNGASLAGLTLQCGNGKGSRSVILDATSLNHAVYVSGVSGVKIAGCVAENAAREGILVENSDSADIANNEVANNDQAMGPQVGQGTPPCPTFRSPGNGVLQCCPDAFQGGPGNFPNDNDDCGEGIHFRSVTNSVIEGNLVHDNIGGILLTDETGANATNLVTNNISRDNTKFGGDCGVTLASHVACAPGSNDVTGCTFAPTGTPGGVSHNVVDGNLTQDNGASGIGMFANPGIPPGSATAANGNLISNNTVKNNGQPGISIHVHAANGNADNNVIVGNTVSGNGGDAEATGGGTPPGLGIEVLSNGSFGVPFDSAAPIVGTTISHNSVSNQAIDVWVGNTATDVSATLNNLKGKDASGVTNGGTGTVTATDNYWGCPKGPNNAGCSSTSGTVLSSPFLSRPAK